MPRDFSSSRPTQHFRDRQAELGPITARALPAPAAARRQLHAHPDLRPHADFLRVFEDQAELRVFSTTGMTLRPIFWASMAISMNSASLKPLQMIGVSL